MRCCPFQSNSNTVMIAAMTPATTSKNHSLLIKATTLFNSVFMTIEIHLTEVTQTVDRAVRSCLSNSYKRSVQEVAQFGPKSLNLGMLGGVLPDLYFYFCNHDSH